MYKNYININSVEYDLYVVRFTYIAYDINNI